MGVPKFFRFLVDRYPCASRIVKEHDIPVYENLYLDMNSIIHRCSHPSTSDVYFRIGKKEFSDEEIFQNVSRYVDLIFHIVKPLELLYLAFDGVAPRAKMNQQRATRYRFANNINKADMNQELDEELFDANCITPGTTFMMELNEHMRHFIANKISTDSAWQKCKIIFNGSEVPGEGEHKIMQFIKYNKAQPNYNPNTRHCLYSLDADLIVLGMCCHEPYFTLIQESETFGKKSVITTPEETDFILLHLCLLREYIQYEFMPVKSEIKFKFDTEKIIDDWILLGFLIGNDFIPQLPNLNIVTGALPLLYQVYIHVLPTLDGYINEAGTLNLARFEKFLNKLSHIEKFKFNEDIDIKNSNKEKISSKVYVEHDFLSKKNEKNDEIQNFEKILNLSNLTLEYKTSDDFTTWKKNYYNIKLKINYLDDSLINKLVEEYIKGIQWILNYYYKECNSWSWYYPYHYAPIISDIKEIKNVNLNFEMNKPLLPLEHLLLVLPPQNVHLLPKPYQSLLTNPSSPVIDFYPTNFEIDQNGKSNEWEAVVLIPFIDEKKLLIAMESCNKKLSLKDRNRNKSGFICIFTYTKTNLGQYPVDTIYGQFLNYAQLEYLKPEDILVPDDKLVQGLCKNVSFDLMFSGFPVLYPICHSFHYELKEKSRIKSNQIEIMILNVLPKPVQMLDEIAKKLLGQTIYVNWPYIQEARVVGVSDFNNEIFLKIFRKRYELSNIRHDKVTDKNLKEKKCIQITQRYKDSFGINIGEIKILVYVFLSLGKQYKVTKSGKVELQTKYSSKYEEFPYQLIVDVKEQKNMNLLYRSVTDIFTPSLTCFLIDHPHYGAMGTVKNVFTREQKIILTLNKTIEPNFSEINEKFCIENNDYMNSDVIAEKLGVSSTLVNRITGSLMITLELNNNKCVNIGLNLKSPKNNKELYKYTKKKNYSWMYSEKVIFLIKAYKEKFPILFENLNKNLSISNFQYTDLFPENSNELSSVLTWLKEQTVSYTTYLNGGTINLKDGSVPKLEKIITDFFEKHPETSVVETKVPVVKVFKPGTSIGLAPIDAKAQHKLLDRVICVRENFTVPLGFKGTIIGIQQKTDKLKNIYEVLFDFPFTGGLTLYESNEHKCYRLTTADFINISFGQRDLIDNKSNQRIKSDNIKNSTASNQKLKQNSNNKLFTVRKNNKILK